MRPRNLLYLYQRRLRAHPVSELLALIGIATGVALVFAAQVANTSITDSAQRTSDGIAGAATLQLTGRSPRGFDARVLERVERLPGVGRAAPFLELRAALRGPRGRRAVTLAGADLALAELRGALVRQLASPGLERVHGLALPAPLARALGVRIGDQVVVETGARAVRAPVVTLLEASEVGMLARSPIAAAPLLYLQRIGDMEGRVSRLLVMPEPGAEEQVRRGLERIADGRLDVGPSDNDVRLLRQAGAPNSQSTALFAAISALVGFLFAFNAMLLTVPERRRFVAELRMDGYDDRAILQMVIFEGLVLGIAASAVGLLLGDQLSRHLFDATPGYLASAFAVGDQRVVTAGAVGLALLSGVAAALLATGRPLADLLSRRPLDAPEREAEGADAWILSSRAPIAGALGLLAGTTAILVLAPAAAIAGIAMLVAAMLLAVPPVLGGGLRAISGLTRRARLPMLVVSLGELRSSALRSCALAATGALAVFGSVAIGGAHRDLLRGLDDDAETFVATADVWVTSGGDENSFTTRHFRPRPDQLASLRESDAVAAVREYRGGLLDMAGRRVWVVARPPDEPAFIPDRQLVEGDVEEATAHLRAGGWIAVSKAIADRTGVEIGEPLEVPTPTGPASFRVAAIVTNLGWPPGALVLNADDYRSRWAIPDVAGLEVDLRPGVPLAEGTRAVEAAIGADSPLVVETSAQRADRLKRQARQGLDRLSQISVLVLIAAVLALAAAMGGVLWQRRPRLAALKLSGFGEAGVWRALLLETGILLGIGCAIGAAFGLYGQALLARALEVVTGFPVQYSAAVVLALATLCGIAFVATAVTALPGYLAARVPPLLGFQED